MENNCENAERGPFDSARLITQALLTGNSENAAMDALGLTDGQRILDVGCGNGAVAARLRLDFPDLEIDGIEVNPALAVQAHSPKRINNVYRLDAVCSEWPAIGPYDCVYTRLVLQHVSKSDLLVSRMVKVAKPGGKVILIDSDHSTFLTVPRLDSLHEALSRCRDTRRTRTPGSNPLIGFHLAELARKVGLTQLETRIVTVSSREFGGNDDPSGTRHLGEALLSFLWSPDATGATLEWCAEVRKAYEEWGVSLDSYFRWSLLFVAGTKPRAESVGIFANENDME